MTRHEPKVASMNQNSLLEPGWTAGLLICVWASILGSVRTNRSRGAPARRRFDAVPGERSRGDRVTESGRCFVPPQPFRPARRSVACRGTRRRGMPGHPPAVAVAHPEVHKRPRPERVPGPWRIELRLCGQSRANSAATTRGEEAAEAEDRGRAGGRDRHAERDVVGAHAVERDADAAPDRANAGEAGVEAERVVDAVE